MCPLGQRKSSTRGLPPAMGCIEARSQTSLEINSRQCNLSQLTVDLTDRSHFRYSGETDVPSSSLTKQLESRRIPRKSLREENELPSESGKLLIKGLPVKDKKVFENSDLVVSDCWKTSTEESPVKFVELLTGNLEDDSDIPIKKRKLDLDEEDAKSPPYTKEFHMLTEVQKAKILTVVENVIKRLANEDYGDVQEQSEQPKVSVSHRQSLEKFFCKKFLLPWVILKAVEMVICHIIQLAFLSEGSYFQRRNEFLPVAVTYYLTLFIVVFSMIVHIGCFSYVGIQNPCYFMGIISSSILTLTTSLGVLIMLSSMEYYRSFTQILVLVLLGILLCSLSAELCLCYVKVKSVWKRIAQTDQYYVT